MLKSEEDEEKRLEQASNEVKLDESFVSNYPERVADSGDAPARNSWQ